MPIIPPQFLSCIFYLYRDREDAEAGKDTGGTGFFVALPTTDGRGHHYCVTNWHVAVRDGYSVIRINKSMGGFEIFDQLGPEDWEYEPGKDDIAIAPLSLHGSHAVANFIGSVLFKTQEEMNDPTLNIGPGDEVFMVGRFVDLDVKETNIPALRFGNISTLPVPIRQPNGYIGLSYCIDMHSRSGYSGSPVFVYRTPGNTLEWAMGIPSRLDSPTLLLLGIHWGQFSDQLPIKERKKIRSESREDEKRFEEYVEGMSGMTCVIPAWRIMELLESKKFVEQRRREDEIRKNNILSNL
jgi:hypothetical protein